MGSKKSIMVYLEDEVYDFVKDNPNRSEFVNNLIKEKIPSSEKDQLKKELKELIEIENNITREIEACVNKSKYENGYTKSITKYYTISLPVDLHDDLRKRNKNISRTITAILQDAGYGLYSADKISILQKELEKNAEKQTAIKLKLAELLTKEDQEMSAQCVATEGIEI